MHEHQPTPYNVPRSSTQHHHHHIHNHDHNQPPHPTLLNLVNFTMPVMELDRIWAQVAQMPDFRTRVQYIEYILKNRREHLFEADFEALERGRQMIKDHIKWEEYENTVNAGPWC